MLKTGDKRKIKSYEENGKTISGRNCGKWCTIVKVFTDEEGQRFCRVRIDGQEAVSSLDYTEENFYPKYDNPEVLSEYLKEYFLPSAQPKEKTDAEIH